MVRYHPSSISCAVGLILVIVSKVTVEAFTLEEACDDPATFGPNNMMDCNW
jgi:hypothetical protein